MVVGFGGALRLTIERLTLNFCFEELLENFDLGDLDLEEDDFCGDITNEGPSAGGSKHIVGSGGPFVSSAGSSKRTVGSGGPLVSSVGGTKGIVSLGGGFGGALSCVGGTEGVFGLGVGLGGALSCAGGTDGIFGWGVGLGGAFSCAGGTEGVFGLGFGLGGAFSCVAKGIFGSSGPVCFFAGGTNGILGLGGDFRRHLASLLCALFMLLDEVSLSLSMDIMLSSSLSAFSLTMVLACDWLSE